MSNIVNSMTDLNLTDPLFDLSCNQTENDNKQVERSDATAKKILQPQSHSGFLIGSSRLGRVVRAFSRAALIGGLTVAFASTPIGLGIGGGVALLWLVVDSLGQRLLHKKGVHCFQDILTIKRIYQDPQNHTDLETAKQRSNSVTLGQIRAFKISAWQRLHGRRGNNFNVVGKTNNGRDIYLSSLPNKNDPTFKTLLESQKVGAIITINEDWETAATIGASSPYKTSEYNALGIEHHVFPFLDHALLDNKFLNQIADKINALDTQLNPDPSKPKKAILIHCRAGVGRSSQGVASYLIKYQNMTAKKAADQIRDGSERGNIPGRPQATIHKKLKTKIQKDGTICGINHFAKSCRATENAPKITPDG